MKVSVLGFDLSDNATGRADLLARLLAPRYEVEVVGPRFGAAYDISGNQSVVLRGGGGIFYDRPDGNTVFSIPGNPPIATSQDLRNGQLQTLGTGLSTAFRNYDDVFSITRPAAAPRGRVWSAARSSPGA